MIWPAGLQVTPSQPPQTELLGLQLASACAAGWRERFDEPSSRQLCRKLEDAEVWGVS